MVPVVNKYGTSSQVPYYLVRIDDDDDDDDDDAPGLHARERRKPAPMLRKTEAEGGAVFDGFIEHGIKLGRKSGIVCEESLGSGSNLEWGIVLM